jgi:hypothetical protein
MRELVMMQTSIHVISGSKASAYTNVNKNNYVHVETFKFTFQIIFYRAEINMSLLYFFFAGGLREVPYYACCRRHV